MTPAEIELVKEQNKKLKSENSKLRQKLGIAPNAEYSQLDKPDTEIAMQNLMQGYVFLGTHPELLHGLKLDKDEQAVLQELRDAIVKRDPRALGSLAAVLCDMIRRRAFAEQEENLTSRGFVKKVNPDGTVEWLAPTPKMEKAKAGIIL